MESKALTRTKSHVKSKLKAALLSQCSHHLIAGHNQNLSNENFEKDFNVQNLLTEMFLPFPYHCDLPKPLLPPSKMQRDCCIKEDRSMQLIHTKVKIQDDINRYLELYKKYSNSLDKDKKKTVVWTKENKKVENTMLPRYLAATAEILECDPDPNFSGSYNWYYSGGTLNGILYDTKNFLIFPFAEELIVLPINLKEYSLFMPDFKNAAKMPLDGDLYQVVCSTANNTGRILTRHKNNCFLYSIFNLDANKVQLLKVDNQFSENPYVSIDLDPSNANIYCTANINRNIIIWDVNKTRHISSGKVPSTKYLEDNWAFVKYDDCKDSIIKFVDRHCVHHYDLRVPLNQSILTMCPKNNLEECESLSTYVTSCKSDHYSYVGSNHNLCLLDNRSPNRAVVKKWTHQFKSSPLFSDVCFRENKEFLVIASQVAGEIAIILNSWNSSEEPPESFSTPFTPPSCVETLSTSHSQGNCLSPHMRNRLSLSNIGCMTTVDTQTNEVFLLTQNSVYDIFYQGIGYNEPLDVTSLEYGKAVYRLKMWEKQMLKNNHCNVISPLVVTKRTNARDIFRTFSNQKLKPSAINNENEDPAEYLPSWKRSVAELNLFVDIFAPELLAPWEVLDETPLVPTTAAPHQKVLSWLGMTERNTEENGRSDNIMAPQETAFEEIQEIPQDPDIFITHDSESIQQLFLPKVKSQTTPSAKKNIRRPIHKVPVACVPTGVKHLHHKALEFDIGVYFEANGHGTIVFKDSAVNIIRSAANNKSLPDNRRVAADALSNIIDVINQTVGDALSDMLLVELILQAKDWDAIAWEKSYRDLPNKQVKVKVQDRSAITTADAERRCVTPKNLQEKIDEIVAKYPKGRSFVRPSGTEDIVRVYAECESASEVEKLAAEVSLAVFDLAGGVGTKPVVP